MVSFLVIVGSIHDGDAQTRPREKYRNAMRDANDGRQSQALTNEAFALYKKGNTTLAAVKLEHALRLDQRNDRALALSAWLAFKAGRHVIAKSQATRALLINNKNALAHLALGRVLIADGKPLAGFDHIRKAADNLPEGPEREEARMALVNLKEQHTDWFARREPGNPGQPAPSPAQMSTVMDEGEVQPAVKPRMAVFSFENVGMADSTMKWGETMAEMLATSLITSKRFTVIERTQLDKILQEQALGQTGALDSETAVVVGKIMGLDAVVVGSVSMLASVYEADARVLNVESGEAITAANARAESANQLRAVAESLAGILAQHASLIPVHHPPADSTK